MMLQVGLAHHRSHDERVVVLAPDAGKCDRAIVDREGQVLFQREGNHLMQPARILERQFEQAFGHAIRRQRRYHNVGLAGLGDQTRQRAAEIGLAIGADLVVHAGEIERIPRALRDRRAHPVAHELQRKYSLSH